MQETNSEYLYHYTTIEKLALILKNRTIRLNPLDKMDDLQEQKTADVENLGKFVFVSSWTADTTESIPMWKMYTDPFAGVRIRLRKNPFVRHGTSGKDIQAKTKYQVADEETLNMKLDSFLDFTHLLNNDYFSPQALLGDILHQVKYTNDISLLEPTVAHYKENTVRLNFDTLGKHKNMHWEFQKEWRYVMFFMSYRFSKAPELAAQLHMQNIGKMVHGQGVPPFRYYDLDIAPSFFEEMEITVSPQMSPGNRVLLETLVEKYNPDATIIDSELLGMI